MLTSQTTANLDAALAKAQGEFGAVTKNAKNPHLRNKYADLGAVVGAIGDALAANGIAYVQSVDEAGGGGHSVSTRIAHAGEWIQTSCPVLWSEGKGTTIAQAFGGGLTYARRYALMAAFGLAPEDDDGESAGRRGQRGGQQNGGGSQRQRPKQKSPVGADEFANICEQRHGIPLAVLNAHRVEVQGKAALTPNEDGFHFRGVVEWLAAGDNAAQVRSWMESKVA